MTSQKTVENVAILTEEVQKILARELEDQARELEQARTIEHHTDLINSMADCIKSLEGIVTQLSKENDKLRYKIEHVYEVLRHHMRGPGEE